MKEASYGKELDDYFKRVGDPKHPDWKDPKTGQVWRWDKTMGDYVDPTAGGGF